MDNKDFVFCGTIVHSTWKDSLVIKRDTSIGVKNGQIVFVDDKDNLENLVSRHGLQDAVVKQLDEWQFLMPGFVDTHAHASQYTYTGTGMDMGLMEWLQTYTYPTEALYKDTDFARYAHEKVVNRTLKCGTTSICYFGTIHKEASCILADIVENQGQRAYVGKVNMTMNCPDFYIEDDSDSIRDTEEFIKYVQAKKNPLVNPIVTPRFALTCPSSLMSKLADLAKKYDVPIQTHISESCKECQLTAAAFPENRHYTDVYDQAGLLGHKTILAHGIHLSDDERNIIQERGCGVSHCPNSNLTLRSGLCDVPRLLSKKIKVGLGTDISGGYSPSMLDAIRTCVNVTNVLTINKEVSIDDVIGSEQKDTQKNGIDAQPYQKLDYKDAFRLATLGGSQVMGLEDKIGNFEVGKDFDALLIDPLVPDSPMDIFQNNSLQDVVQKFIFMGDDRNIVQVFVAGRLVKGDNS